MRALKSPAPKWVQRNRVNARTAVRPAHTQSREARPIETFLTPWGEYEHAIEGVQVPALKAFRARSHRWFTTQLEK